MAGRGGIVATAVLLVVVLVMMNQQYAVEGQQDVGQCLMNCGQKAMNCASRCGAQYSCYQGCGNTDIGCVTACLGPMPPAPPPQGSRLF